MSQTELKFASIKEALQHLSDQTGKRVIIGARLTPDEGDYVIFLNPRTDHYHVFQFPGSNIKEFAKSDSVKDLRAKGKKGQELIFDDSMSLEKMAKEVSDMFAGLSAEDRKKLKAEDMRGIYMADSLASDRPTKDGSNKFDIDFVTDRGYTGIGSIGTLKSKEDVLKDKERRHKQLKKAPSRYKKKVEKEEFDPYQGQPVPSGADLQKMFNSSEEALQYLSDITGKVVRISK